MRVPPSSRAAFGALGFAACALVAGCSESFLDPRSQTGPNPILPEPRQYLVPPMHVAPVRRWREGEAPKVPADLEVGLFASGLLHPRSLHVLPNGDVLVVESNGPKAPVYRPKEIIMPWVQGFAGALTKAPNRITLFRDADGDGRPELRATFLDKLNSPFGIALVGEDLYVANADAVIRYSYRPGQTRISGPGTKLLDLPGGPINHHWTKDLIASADGTKLYATVGSNSNITENGLEAEHGRAAIWEIDRATGAARIYASGLRNPTSIDWEPVTGRLWAVVNERDELGPDLVPDYLTSVRDGGFYGWPYSYYGSHVDPRVMPRRPDLVARAIVPDYALSSHVAPLGLLFSRSQSLPPRIRGGAFVSEHGSWDRPRMNGYKVVYVRFQNGRPIGMPEDVVTGFLDPKNRAHGRPVGLAMDRSGALLIADDVGDRIWRVTARKPGTPTRVAGRSCHPSPAERRARREVFLEEGLPVGDVTPKRG